MAGPRSTHHDGNLRERRGGGGAEHRSPHVVSGQKGFPFEGLSLCGYCPPAPLVDRCPFLRTELTLGEQGLVARRKAFATLAAGGAHCPGPMGTRRGGALLVMDA
jgi:hypothetical protein